MLRAIKFLLIKIPYLHCRSRVKNIMEMYNVNKLIFINIYSRYKIVDEKFPTYEKERTIHKINLLKNPPLISNRNFNLFRIFFSLRYFPNIFTEFILHLNLYFIFFYSNNFEKKKKTVGLHILLRLTSSQLNLLNSAICSLTFY